MCSADRVGEAARNAYPNGFRVLQVSETNDTGYCCRDTTDFAGEADATDAKLYRTSRCNDRRVRQSGGGCGGIGRVPLVGGVGGALRSRPLPPPVRCWLQRTFERSRINGSSNSGTALAAWDAGTTASRTPSVPQVTQVTCARTTRLSPRRR